MIRSPCWIFHAGHLDTEIPVDQEIPAIAGKNDVPYTDISLNNASLKEGGIVCYI